MRRINMDWQNLDVDLSNAKFPLVARIGGQPVVVLQVPGGFRGVQRNCPHQQFLLTKATLLGGGSMVKCPIHNFVFRLKDGSPVNCPGYQLRVFDIKEERGILYGRPVAVSAED